MNEHHYCLICKSDNLKKIIGYEKAHLCKCKECGFIFSKTIPSIEELQKYYDCYGRNDYLSPTTIKRYNELLDKFEVYRKTGRLLDVGCGAGYFLEVAKKRGWEVYGTEYSDYKVDVCKKKGINIKKGELNANDYTSNFVDVITSFEVIEHINNPLEELTHFQKILRPGGLVYVTTPNFNSLLRYYLKDKYNIINYPEHLCYYSPKTLRKSFELNGFKTLKIETTGISLTRFKGTIARKRVSSDSEDEKIRNKIENKKSLQLAKNGVNKMLTLFGKGDSLKGWFIKVS